MVEYCETMLSYCQINLLLSCIANFSVSQQCGIVYKIKIPRVFQIEDVVFLKGQVGISVVCQVTNSLFDLVMPIRICNHEKALLPLHWYLSVISSAKGCVKVGLGDNLAIKIIGEEQA